MNNIFLLILVFYFITVIIIDILFYKIINYLIGGKPQVLEEYKDLTDINKEHLDTYFNKLSDNRFTDPPTFDLNNTDLSQTDDEHIDFNTDENERPII
jgi:hypothetical protein